MRPVVCRTLGLSAHPQPVLDVLRAELDRTYREVAQRLPNNPAVRFEKINGKEELILSPLEKLQEPVSLVKLREAVAARLPRVDIPEIVVEIAARTGFAEAFMHLTKRTARVARSDDQRVRGADGRGLQPAPNRFVSGRIKTSQWGVESKPATFFF